MPHIRLNGESSQQNMKVVTTTSLHRILPHIEQRFYKVAQTEKAGEYVVIVVGHQSVPRVAGLLIKFFFQTSC